MRILDSDIELLSGIRPSDFASYLRSHGWASDPGGHNAADIWYRDDAADFGDASQFNLPEILLPRASSVRDYLARVSEAIQTLQRFERRPWSELVRDVALSAADIWRFRRPSEGDTIPIEDGRTLIDRLMEVMTSAACAAVQPRAVIPPRRPLQAIDYLRHVQLGQTERGSFVLTLVSKVEPLYTPGMPGLIEEWDDPFPRRVTKTLASALQAVDESVRRVEDAGSFDAFVDNVQRGVSANLCDALAGMVSSQEWERPIGITLSWAASRPAPSAEPVHFEIAADRAPVLRQAAAKLRSVDPIESTLITGIVERLARDKSSEEGEVTIATVIEGRIRKLHVVLPPADYRQAVNAHGDRRQVFFQARIERVGRTFRATNVEGFRIA